MKPKVTDRPAAAGALVAAAPVLWAAVVVRPERADNAATMFDDVAAARSLEILSSGLFVLGAALLAIGAVGVGGLARRQGSRRVTVGAALLAAGAAWFAVRAYSGVQLWAFTDPSLGAEQARDLYVKVSETAGFAVMLPLLAAFLIAPIVLGLGLRRLGLVPTAAVAVYGGGLLVFLALETRRAGEAVGFGLMMAALCCYGIALVRGPGVGPAGPAP